MTGTSLPRLVYLGDVPVEASYHGSALLYRLLEDYPAGRLIIVEAGNFASRTSRRLTGTTYHTRLMPMSRIQFTRLSRWYTAGALRAAGLRAQLLQKLASSARPEAILTVAHGYSWITAAKLARRLSVPLHLICHDEWAREGDMQEWKDRVFGEYYRCATSRLCVSPFMADEYERRYGARCTILYPSRAANAQCYESPPARLAHSGRLTCVFAGTLSAYGAALQSLASCLARRGGRLVIYGPLTIEEARASGLVGSNIEIGGLLPSAHLIQRLREMADVLYVPMSFAADTRKNMEISFPSKLTDYTAAGLPLLIHGPPYCSAVRWATENAGVAEVVNETSEAALAESLTRLENQEYRMQLAKAALVAGKRYFSHRSAIEVFHAALSGAKITRPTGFSAIGQH